MYAHGGKHFQHGQKPNTFILSNTHSKPSRNAKTNTLRVDKEKAVWLKIHFSLFNEHLIPTLKYFLQCLLSVEYES